MYCIVGFLPLLPSMPAADRPASGFAVAAVISYAKNSWIHWFFAPMALRFLDRLTTGNVIRWRVIHCAR
jgi:hypothetical protein